MKGALDGEMNTIFKKYGLRHPFHMVKNSPWPFVVSQTVFIFLLALVNFFHFTKYSAVAVFVSFFIFLLPVFFWFRDIIRESTYMGVYTIAVQKKFKNWYAAIHYIWNYVFF